MFNMSTFKYQTCNLLPHEDSTSLGLLLRLPANNTQVNNYSTRNKTKKTTLLQSITYPDYRQCRSKVAIK